MSKIKKSPSEQIFDVFNISFMILLSALFLYPLLYVVFASFSNPDLLMQHRGLLFSPKGFTTICYETIIKYPLLLTSYKNTIFYVTVGTFLNMFFTILAAFVVSRRDFMFSNFIMKMIIITMFLSGGMIPGWLLVRNLGMYNTIWAILIPGVINAWNMILMRNAFMQVPYSIEESAKIDGANELRILCSIILPLSLPTLAVMTLFFGVARWNAWFNAAIFLQNRNLFPLQLIMREILIQNQISDVMSGMDSADVQISMTIKYAAIVVSTLPILCLYPFVQKYFVKGMTVGAVKG